MTKFIIGVREVHISYREVEADTLEKAVELGMDIGYEYDVEYSHTPDAPISIYDADGKCITDDYHAMSQEAQKKPR